MTPSNWLVLLSALLTSFGVSALLVMTQRWHGRLSHDHDLRGIQKTHTPPVPRVGGIAIAAGLVAAAATATLLNTEHSGKIQGLLLCAIPAFAAGLMEDLTKRVSVSTRLMASAVSGALAVCLLDAYLTRLNIPGLDWVIGLTPVAMVFTSFAVSGVTNAINIIDGLHGLASGSVAIMLAGLGTLAWLQQDTLVMTLCIMGSGSAFGFMALNYPFGKVFLGDGGAYLLGFWLAECAVLLAARNPKVSPSAVLLACLYPIWETAFSMYRRLVVKRVSCSHPDKLHLHHLLLRRIIEQRLEGTPAAWVSHSVTSAAIWTMVFGCQMAALASQTSQVWAAAACIVFVITYQTLYTNTAKGFRPSADAEEPKLGPSGWSGLA